MNPSKSTAPSSFEEALAQADAGPVRIAAFWTSRDDNLVRIAQQLYMLVTALRAVGPEFASWVTVDEEIGADVPVSSADVARRALEQGSCPWKTGAVERTAYDTRLWLERSTSPVSLWLTAGIESLAALGVYTPNRLRLTLPTSDRTVCERALRAVIASMRPDWACAGREDEGTLPTAVFGRGEPLVGWLTFLASAYGDAPPRLPEHALALPIGSQGTLYAAHAALYHRGTPEQRKDVRALAATLRAAGSLSDAYALAAQSRVEKTARDGGAARKA